MCLCCAHKRRSYTDSAGVVLNDPGPKSLLEIGRNTGQNQVHCIVPTTQTITSVLRFLTTLGFIRLIIHPVSFLGMPIEPVISII